MPSSAASSSPRSSGAGGPSRRQSSAVGEHLPGEGEVGLDRLLGGEGPAAAGGEAVGDGEQGHVGGDRLGRAQVLVDPARRQRRLVDEEAEPQVVQGEGLQVLGQLAAGPQAAAEPADDLGAVAVVADEGDVAVALAPGRRLADVVQEGAEAQRRAAGHLVGERLGEQRRRLGGALAGEAVEVVLDLQRLLEHGERVAVDVEVVVGALLDPAAAPPARAGRPRSGRARRAARGRAAGRARRRAGAARRAGARRRARAARRASARASSSVPGSIASPSSAARRAARSRRSGSAAKLRSPTARRRPRSRSARPP